MLYNYNMTTGLLPKTNHKMITIYPGEFYVTLKHEVISTVLGSCISVCLYDNKKGICGMNHFMLPKNTKVDMNETNDEFLEHVAHSNALRYGVTSMEILINNMISLGGSKENFTAKVFGGANILPVAGKSVTVGEQNIHFIFTFLKTEGIKISNYDIGKKEGRKILFFTKHNSVYVKKIPISKVHEEDLKDPKPKAGEIVLFD